MHAPSRLVPTVLALCLASCMAPTLETEGEVMSTASNLSASQRRVRAGEIRDAAAANGITQGWLFAGIADAETGMSHCWSELTWACQGPASSDCGGGPVVAGAGDGPCSLRQGGLGMFQFDAGTFDDTLRREGNRVLSIAGNTAAAVDFVVAMIIRSAYVPGVDTREQAIAWMNGVRVGNDRWDAWVRTVTHYYNGCAPSYSCFTQRYAHYRDHASGVYDEMGADFWSTGTEWSAAYVSQSFPLARDPFEIEAGQSVAGYLEMRNTGTRAWTPGQTFLGTTEPRDANSPIAAADWVNPHRAATIDRAVAPGGTGRFVFSVRAPDAPGTYPQFFGLVQEGVAWFSVPAENVLQIKVTSTPAAPPAPVDADGDGVVAAQDCDDRDPRRKPGATEVCGDGVDQDCNGVDPACAVADAGPVVRDEDGGAVARADGGGLVVPVRPDGGTVAVSGSLGGSCAVARGASGDLPWALGVLGVALVVVRRRR